MLKNKYLYHVQHIVFVVIFIILIQLQTSSSNNNNNNFQGENININVEETNNEKTTYDAKSHGRDSNGHIEDCTVVFVTLDGKVLAYDGWKGGHKWSIETGGQLLSSSVPRDTVPGYNNNNNAKAVSSSSSMIVPGVDGSIFSLHANENIDDTGSYIANPSSENGGIMSSYSSPKLKLHRLPVTAQDIVSQPFLVQTEEEFDINGDIIPSSQVDPALLYGDKSSKVFVLDLRSGKIKDGSQDEQDDYTTTNNNEDDEDEGFDLDDDSLCHDNDNIDDTDGDEYGIRIDDDDDNNNNLHSKKTCKEPYAHEGFPSKKRSSDTLLFTRTDFLVRAINTRRGSEMWNASVGRIDIIAPRSKRRFGNNDNSDNLDQSAPRVSYNTIGNIEGFDRKTGELLWNSRLNQQPASMHIFMGNRLVEEIYSFTDTSSSSSPSSTTAAASPRGNVNNNIKNTPTWFLGSLDRGWSSVFALPSETELDKLPHHDDDPVDRSSSDDGTSDTGTDLVPTSGSAGFHAYHRVEMEDDASNIIAHRPQVVAQRPVNIVPIELANNLRPSIGHDTINNIYDPNKGRQQLLPNTDYFSSIVPPSQDHSHTKDSLSLFQKWRRRKEMKKAIEAATNVLAGEDGAVHSYVFQGGLVLSWRGVTSFLIILVCLMIGVFLLASRYYRQWYQVKLNDIRNTPPPTPTFPANDSSVPLSPLPLISNNDAVINELELEKPLSTADSMKKIRTRSKSNTSTASSESISTEKKNKFKETSENEASDSSASSEDDDYGNTDETTTFTNDDEALFVNTGLTVGSASRVKNVTEKNADYIEMKRTASADSALSDDLAAMVCENRYRNDYEEYKQLGRGGFGAVYACKNRLDGRKYAIKKIRLSSSKHMEKQLHKVLREVKIIARVSDHKNIVRYFQAWIESVDPDSSYEIVYGNKKNEDASYSGEFSEESTSYTGNTSSPLKSQPTEYDLILYIQMEYCSQTLAEYINDPKRKVDLAEILGITKQIALGIQHFHEYKSGLIHRDLKPENVFFHEKEVKLGDFGLSRPEDEDVLEDEGEDFEQHDKKKDGKSSNNVEEDSNSTVLNSTNAQSPREFRRKRSRMSFGLGHNMHKSMSPGSRLSRSFSRSISSKYSGAYSSEDDGEMTSQIGTYTYASPEQIDGGEYDSSTDIFSLGVILFEMCHLPFPTGMERIVTISNAREGIFATYWESLSKSNPGICNLLNRLLSTIPSNRPTAAEVVETCEILRCEILNTLTESKRDELEAENKRLKALVARYSGDFNDDGSDTRLPTPTAPNKSVSSSSPRIITRNSPVMFVPTTITNDPTSSGHSNSGKSNNGKKVHLQRLNTM